MNHNDNRRVKMTKKILQETLLEMLEEQSIHEISIRALCEKADLNRSTFYKYYGSQYDLLNEMETELLTFTDKLSNITSISSASDSIIEILRFTEKHANLCKLLFTANIDPDFPKKLLALPSINHAMELTTKHLSTEDAVYIQDFFFYGCYQIIKKWINKENREAPEKMAKLLIQLFPLDI